MDKIDNKKRIKNTFLGRKRDPNPLFSSSLFKKLFQTESKAQSEPNRRYEDISWRYKHLFSFNWDDKCIKDTLYPMNNLTPNALWFMFCAAYFPSEFDIVKENVDELNEVLSSFSGDIEKLGVKKMSLFKSRFNLVNEILSLNSYYEKEEEMNNSTGNSSNSSAQEMTSNSPFTFGEMESKLYETLAKVKMNNERRISELKVKMKNAKTMRQGPCDNGNGNGNGNDIKDELFKDMKYNRKEQSDFFEYLHKHQKKKMKALYKTEKIFEFEEEINRTKEDDDWVCCVCNNGDQDENQLIYECESCSVTVHQTCYGIKTQSVQHWTCDPCSKMSKKEALKLECILCRVKGGAMKQVQLPRNCTFVNNILDCRENLSSDLSSSSSIDSDDNANGNARELNDNDNIFPKYNSCIIIPLQDYSMINCAWVHLSCALWNPIVSFGNFEEKTQIGNIEMIEYKKFAEKCHICNMRNYGPTLNCNMKGCSFKCHPECARINKYHLEIEKDKSTLNYNVYCLEHEPIKLIKTIGNRRNMFKKDVEEFDHGLNRIYKSFEKEYKVSLLSVNTQGRLGLNMFDGYNSNGNGGGYSKRQLALKKCSIVIENGNNEYIAKPLGVSSALNIISLNQNQRQFLNKLSVLCKSYSNSNRVVLKKQLQSTNHINQPKRRSLRHNNKTNTTTTNQHYDYTIEHNNNTLNKENLLSYSDLFKSDFPWEQLRFKNYSRTNLIEYFKKLIPDQECYESLLVKPTLTTDSIQSDVNDDNIKPRVEIIHENGEKTIREFEEDTNLYCYCKQRYSPGDIMICCDKGFDCIGSHEGWYHVQCIKDTKDMTKEEIVSYKFVCEQCKKGDD